MRKFQLIFLVMAMIFCLCSCEKEPQTVLDIRFETAQGFFSEDISVVLQTNIPEADIYYTLDAEDPDLYSDLYREPILLECPKKTEGFTVRAKAVYDDQETEIISRTFFLGEEITDRFDTLVFSVTTDPDNLYDDEIGIMVAGNIRKNYVAENPGEKITIYSPANFRMRGRDWERPAYLEVFDQDGNLLLQQNIGIRLHGGASRTTHVKKSLKLIARREYSPETGKLKVAFFQDNTDVNGNLLEKYDRVVLRNSGNDFNRAYIRDEVLCLIAEDSGFPDTQAVRPVSVWLNGEYHGAFWLHEVFHDDYFVERYGGEAERWGVVGGDENEDVNGDEYNKELINGPETTVEDYNHMYSYAYKDMTNDSVFNEWSKLVDVDNFLRYYALKIYAGDTDWPQHNNKAYRYYPEDGQELAAPMDGKWRYLFYDTDYSLSLAAEPDDNMMQRILYGDNHRRSSDLLKAVLERPDMKAKFAGILCDYMYGAFSYDYFCDVLDGLHAQQANELSYFANINAVRQEIAVIKTFIKERPAVIRQQLVSVLGIRNSTFRLLVKGNENASLQINTWTAPAGTGIDGRYFYVCPITVSALPCEGHTLDYWLVNGERVDTPSLDMTYRDRDDTGTLTVEAVLKPN